ncbi:MULTISPECIES: hypothetical protein [Rhizobium]|uniref:hypothetical protein n=1 Tax=Rhizobium TaxID=379 RepID=UPI0018855087|nr:MULTISPECIES: hypothetical protein [Rhizobium]
MYLVVFAAISYLILAMILVIAVDNMVGLFFRETSQISAQRLSTLARVIAVSRKYYRR